VRTVSPCGGGYGDPLARDPRRVLDDVLDGLVSEKNAREQYGVVVKDGEVDSKSTERLRAEMRRSGTLMHRGQALALRRTLEPAQIGNLEEEKSDHRSI
jgi:N-methylhydantoinase B